MDRNIRYCLQWAFLPILMVAAGICLADAARTSPVRIVVLSQITKSDRVVSPGAQATTAAQDDANQFNTLTQDTAPGGFLDSALKAANLPTPINIDPKAMDPRFVALTRSLTAYPQSSDVFAISLTWPDQSEATAIVNAMQAQYVMVESGHQTLVVLDPDVLAAMNSLQLAIMEYIQGDNFKYPNLKEIGVLDGQLSKYLPANASEFQPDGHGGISLNGLSYSLNPTLSEKPFGKVQNPSQTVMIYQTNPDKDGNRYVGYADGDCKLIVAANWDAAMKASKIP